MSTTHKLIVHVCLLEVLKWVVGDLSAASAVVLISPVDSLCSECGSARGSHFMGFSYEHNTQVDCSCLSARIPHSV